MIRKYPSPMSCPLSSAWDKSKLWNAKVSLPCHGWRLLSWITYRPGDDSVPAIHRGTTDSVSMTLIIRSLVRPRHVFRCRSAAACFIVQNQILQSSKVIRPCHSVTGFRGSSFRLSIFNKDAMRAITPHEVRSEVRTQGLLSARWRAAIGEADDVLFVFLPSLKGGCLFHVSMGSHGQDPG
jgi:hypothetical protein